MRGFGALGGTVRKVVLGLVGALAACLAPGAALANDSTFGGAPADLVPLAEQQVRMLGEDVVLTTHQGESLGEWQVEAKYQFQNLGSSDVSVQVGFPEFRCPSDEGGDCADVAFRDLVTLVDGAPVQHRQGKLTKQHGWADFLGVVWLFDVTFPVGRPVSITHRYRVTSGGDVMGNRYTSYVTRTGRSWAGSIGRATFTAIFPPYTRFVRDVEAPGLRVIAPRLVLGPGPPHVELRLEGKDWKPEGGVHFSYNTASTLTLDPIDVKKLAGKDAYSLFSFDRCPLGEDEVDAQACLNDLYASRGYPFKNAALTKKYYAGNPAFRRASSAEGKVWVRDASPLAAFTTDWFDSYDRSGFKEWTALLAKQRPDQGVAAASGAPGAEAPVGSTPPGTTGAPPSAVLEERRNQAEPQTAPVAAAPAPWKPAASGCVLHRPSAARRRLVPAWLAIMAGLLAARVRRRRSFSVPPSSERGARASEAQ